ncbi:hypothetical protein ABZT03_41140, partial [Streptomyces sp. NPDC005574]|uniref:hypothetical protein n=1 Tax=Streptomyces sp. NPDC005574 TaxID=3156891 RepID=UPI00339FEA42
LTGSPVRQRPNGICLVRPRRGADAAAARLAFPERVAHRRAPLTDERGQARGQNWVVHTEPDDEIAVPGKMARVKACITPAG